MINPNDYASKVKQAENLSKQVYQLEQENAELKAQIASALVHTIDGTCYVKCADIMHEQCKKTLSEIEARAIEKFKSHIKSGLKIVNEPRWYKHNIDIDDYTYIEVMLSEFDDYANQLRKKANE